MVAAAAVVGVAGVPRFRWTSTGGLLKSISAGRSGVWGTNNDDSIFYRKDTYGDPTNRGSDWIHTEGGLFIDGSGQALGGGLFVCGC